uniref:Helicase C-terminal domain-containing protein n=1 Tax=Setaria digitata TaxID=48799 RepID=A0A915PDT0_9BILA
MDEIVDFRVKITSVRLCQEIRLALLFPDSNFIINSEMEPELRKRALSCIENCVPEIQVVIIVLTRELAFKVARQLNEDAGGYKCVACINDRRFELHVNEIKEKRCSIISGTLGRIDILFYRNALKPAYIKELYILDSVAMVNFPLKRPLERVLGFIQRHIRITLHLPPNSSIVRQIQHFTGDVYCCGAEPELIQSNHFALHVSDEMRKMDTLCGLCRTNTSVPILVCCTMQGTAFANAKILRAQNLPVVTLTSDLSSEDIRTAIDTFQSSQVRIMITTGYIRGLIDLKSPIIIINYDLPRPDAYARRVNFMGNSRIAERTVFISLIKMSERQKLSCLKRKLGLRWILEMCPD